MVVWIIIDKSYLFVQVVRFPDMKSTSETYEKTDLAEMPYK